MVKKAHFEKNKRVMVGIVNFIVQLLKSYEMTRNKQFWLKKLKGRAWGPPRVDTKCTKMNHDTILMETDFDWML